MKLILHLFSICLFFSTQGQVDKRFTLITMLYNEKHEGRRSEYITCLEKNLAHPQIKEIHILYDTSNDEGENHLLNYLKSQPVTLTYINDRVTYGECFTLTNEMYPESRIILSNADIYFNDTLSALENYDLTGKFLALTRHDVEPGDELRLFIQRLKKRKWDSQDTWIFRTPIRKFENDDIKLGLLGCDLTIAKQAVLSRLKVINPCMTIQCCHLHLTKVRHYPTTFYPESGHYSVRGGKLR